MNGESLWLRLKHFFPEVSFREAPLTFNTNPPAHLATQAPLLFSLSFISRQFSCLPPPPLTPPPSQPLHLQDSWKLTKENFCLRLQIPVLSVSSSTKCLIISKARSSESLVKYGPEGSADQQVSTSLKEQFQCAS